MDAESKASAAKGRSGFFLGFTCALAAVLAVAFARSFFLQPLFSAPPLTVPLIIHGICGTAWFALLIWQSRLVRSGRGAEHRRLGHRIGKPLAAVAVLSALWIVVLSQDGVNTGSGLPDSTALFIQTGTIAWFTVLAVLGFRATARPDYHKRYMVLATITMLAPAYSRIARLLVDGRPPADSAFLAVPLVAALLIHDLRKLGRPHPVTLWAGLGYLGYVSLRLPIARSDLWNQTIAPLILGS